MNDTERYYTVREAADALHVSTDTIRRRMRRKDNALKHETRKGPRGEYYAIPESALTQWSEIRDVAPVERPVLDVTEFMDVVRTIRETNERLTTEVDELRSAVTKLTALVEEREHHSMWTRLFGRRKVETK